MKEIFKNLSAKLARFWYSIYDPRRLTEMSGERVVLSALRATGFLENLQGKRILEIGPKHGLDSLILDRFNPSELVLIDLAEKTPLVKTWLPNIACKTRYIEGNILYFSPQEIESMGSFDLILCSGVLYHNVEQIRILKRIYNLLNLEGKVIIESATTRDRKLENLNVVELYYPNFYRNIPTVTHLPSRLAIKSWLEMVGFEEVQIQDIYSKSLCHQRAVLTGIKTARSTPYISYEKSELNPIYPVGEAK